MDRLACVDLPALPLQLLLADHPEWRGFPAAVVAEDRPQAPVLWVDELAREAGVLPGMRHAAALSLQRDLRAGVVPEHRVQTAVDAITGHLRRFTPDVEPSRDEPGVFWLDAGGLQRLVPSLEAWAGEIAAEMEYLGYDAAVAVGFTRFGSYAAVKGHRGVGVIDDPATERRLARAVDLARLDIDPRFREALRKLAITTLGGLVDLPAGGIMERFGPAAYRLHRLAAGTLWDPLQAEPPREQPSARTLLDEPIHDTTRLLFVIKGLIDQLVASRSPRGEAITGLGLRLILERGADHRLEVQPAAPTLDAAELLLLCRLRLDAVGLPAGVIEAHLAADTAPRHPEQEPLVREGPGRDLAAADRALAALRAELGPDAVTRARVREAHLPEARFAFDPLAHLPPPRPRDTTSRPLVRRLSLQPTALRAPRHGAPQGWLLRALGMGRIVEQTGPHVLRGGWWGRHEVEREYHYALTERGDLLWMFLDRRRKRWVLQGRVE